MTSVGYNFLCGRPQGADPRPQASTWAWPPSCGRHNWMVWPLISACIRFETLTLFPWCYCWCSAYYAYFGLRGQALLFRRTAVT